MTNICLVLFAILIETKEDVYSLVKKIRKAGKTDEL